jgi:exodeoxyribonuclease VII large subunit
VASEPVISVAELARRLKRAVEASTGSAWVEGEIGSLKQAPSGHAYFTLKDEREDAIIDCVVYRMAAQRARRHLAEGARVQLWGRATVWAPRGRLQFIAESVRPAGRGALLEALERLKERLAAEGLFDSGRKRSLPAEPRVVGVVTSGTGAAFHDIRTVAFRRGGARLVLSAALVQGDDAPDSIVRAIDRIERYPGLDVLIVGRGGGSIEDLMAFSDERVVRRIAACQVAVVSAVGHEIDFSLTDLVADVRAATPSQAAELVIPDAAAQRELLRQSLGRLTHEMSTMLVRERARVLRLRGRLSDPRFVIAQRQQLLDEFHTRLGRGAQRALARRRTLQQALHRRLIGRHPRAGVARSRGALGPLFSRLGAAIRMYVERGRGELGEQRAHLDSLSPLAVLARGYAIALDAAGHAVVDAGTVSVSDAIELRLHRGRLDLRVARVRTDVSSPDATGQSGAASDRTGTGQSGAASDRTGTGQSGAASDRTGTGQAGAASDRTGTAGPTVDGPAVSERAEPQAKEPK